MNPFRRLFPKRPKAARPVDPYGRRAVAQPFLARRAGRLVVLTEDEVAAQRRRRIGVLAETTERVVVLAGAYAALDPDCDARRRKLAAARLSAMLDCWADQVRRWPDLPVIHRWGDQVSDAGARPRREKCPCGAPATLERMASLSSAMRDELARYARQAAECSQLKEPPHEE